MQKDIIPFGKYKGKDIFTLATDKSYADWLVSQPWFREKYTNIYNIIINNFREANDTPEHNKIQVKFLESNYALKLAFLLYPELFYWNSHNIKKELSEYLKENNISNDDLELVIASMNKEKLLNISPPSFEEGHDVSYVVTYGINLELFFNKTRSSMYPDFKFIRRNYIKISIEIKPTIGDDFPSVLRQMKASMPTTMFSDRNQYHNYRCLLLEKYIGESATKEQFINYFDSQGYNIIFTHEINSTHLPTIENNLNFTPNEFI